MNPPARPAYNSLRLRMALGEELIMDGRQTQIDRHRSRQGYGEYHAASSRVLQTVGLREHEILMAEGHYRCPHCRRADVNEMSAPGRMR
ncbi:MAG: hypothetical protein A2Y76_03885 [Planctomycetes bacterium RBG_13_60_9]|nr:MAG: hypothetical protein A2Y76_03885 [Planctomycetes bacterium RBG_13_60_9]